MAIIKNYLYNKEVELIFNEFKHSYYIEGVKVPSVTTILSVISKPALLNWGVNMAIESIKEQLKPGTAYDEIQLQEILNIAKSAHFKKKTDAGNMGTFVHNWVSDYILGKEPEMPVNTELVEAVRKFLIWEKEHAVKFILSEQTVYSKQHGFTGTLDFVAKIDGQLVLGDLKTSSAIYDEMWLQVAAYRLARTEEFPQEKYSNQAILRIGRDGSFEFALAHEYDKHATTFLHALGLYRELEKMKDDKKNLQEGE